MGTVEKDHAITVALGFLARLSCARDLVFKGGTALRKVHFPDYRFSQDLDFTASRDVAADLRRAHGTLREAGREAQVRFGDITTLPGTKDSKNLRIRYRDMNDHPSSIRVQLSLRERIVQRAERLRIVDPYGVLGDDVRIRTMALPEMLAEKVRALHMRTEPRDLYDAWVLLDKKVRPDPRLVRIKLTGWMEDARVDLPLLERRIQRVETKWERDLRPLLAHVPPYDEVASEVLDRLKDLVPSG